MRLHRGVPMFAAVVTLAGVSAPTAYAFDANSPGGGGGQPAPLVQSNSGSSSDWLIGVGAAGGIALLGTGMAATARSRRPTATRATRATGRS